MATYIGFGPSDASQNASTYELHIRQLENAHDRSANAATAYSRELDAWRLAHPGQPDNPAIVAKINSQNQTTKELGNQIIQLTAKANGVPAFVVADTFALSQKLGRPVSYQEYARRVNADHQAEGAPLAFDPKALARGTASPVDAATKRLDNIAINAGVPATKALGSTSLGNGKGATPSKPHMGDVLHNVSSAWADDSIDDEIVDRVESAPIGAGRAVVGWVEGLMPPSYFRGLAADPIGQPDANEPHEHRLALSPSGKLVPTQSPIIPSDGMQISEAPQSDVDFYIDLPERALQGAKSAYHLATTDPDMAFDLMAEQNPGAIGANVGAALEGAVSLPGQIADLAKLATALPTMAKAARGATIGTATSFLDASDIGQPASPMTMTYHSPSPPETNVAIEPSASGTIDPPTNLTVPTGSEEGAQTLSSGSERMLPADDNRPAGGNATATRRTASNARTSRAVIRRAPKVRASGKRGIIKTIDVAKAIQKALDKSGPALAHDSPASARIDAAKATARSDIKYHKKAMNGLGSDFFTSDTAKMEHYAIQQVPELADPDWMTLFKSIIAGTSSNVAVKLNYKIALNVVERAAAEFRDGKSIRLPLQNDTIPPRNFHGRRPEAQIAKLQRIIDGEGGVSGAAAWLRSDHTVAELRKYNVNVSGKSTDMAPGFGVLGPKLGNLALNLDGVHNVATKDVWFTRMWNRWMRNMFDDKGRLISKPRNSSERQVMDTAMQEIAAELNMSVDELQGQLWYNEKSLYKSLGARVTGDSYGSAAEEFAGNGRGSRVWTDNPEAQRYGPNAFNGGLGAARRNGKTKVSQANGGASGAGKSGKGGKAKGQRPEGVDNISGSDDHPSGSEHVSAGSLQNQVAQFVPFMWQLVPPHVVPPSPSSPIGPTLSPAAIAAHRAMRTAHLG